MARAADWHGHQGTHLRGHAGWGAGSHPGGCVLLLAPQGGSGSSSVLLLSPQGGSGSSPWRLRAASRTPRWVRLITLAAACCFPHPKVGPAHHPGGCVLLPSPQGGSGSSPWRLRAASLTQGGSSSSPWRLRAASLTPRWVRLITLAAACCFPHPRWVRLITLAAACCFPHPKVGPAHHPGGCVLLLAPQGGSGSSPWRLRAASLTPRWVRLITLAAACCFSHPKVGPAHHPGGCVLLLCAAPLTPGWVQLIQPELCAALAAAACSMSRGNCGWGASGSCVQRVRGAYASPCRCLMSTPAPTCSV